MSKLISVSREKVKSKFVHMEPETSISHFFKKKWHYISIDNPKDYFKNKKKLSDFIKQGTEYLFDLIPVSNDHLNHDLMNATQLILLKLKNSNKIEGVTSIDIFKIKDTNKYLLYWNIATIDKKWQGSGAYVFSGLIHLANFVNESWVGSFTLSRSFNPRVYGSFARRSENIYPKIGGRSEISKKNIEIVKDFVQFFYVKDRDKFEPENFIFRNVYNGEKVFWDDDGNFCVPQDKSEEINRYFKQNLNYERGDGQLMFCQFTQKEIDTSNVARISVEFKRKSSYNEDLYSIFQIERG